jgi:hypothetical protein
VKGNSIFFSNKGPGPLQREDNLKNAKIRWGQIKIFARTRKDQNFMIEIMVPEDQEGLQWE